MSVRLAACCGSLVRVWDVGSGPAAAMTLLDEYRPHGRAAVNALLEPCIPSLNPSTHTSMNKKHGFSQLHHNTKHNEQKR